MALKSTDQLSKAGLQTCVNGLLFKFSQFPCSIFTLRFINRQNTVLLAGRDILKLFFHMVGVAEIEVTVVIFLTEGSLHNFQLSDTVISTCRMQNDKK